MNFCVKIFVRIDAFKYYWLLYVHTGYEPTEDRFPLDETIVVDINMVRGSFIDYVWDFGDGTSSETFESEYVLHKYKEVGKLNTVRWLTL